MLKSSSKTSSNIDKPKGLTFRDAIFMLVGAAICGGSVAAYLSSKTEANQQTQTRITDVNGPQKNSTTIECKGKTEYYTNDPFSCEWMSAEEFSRLSDKTREEIIAICGCHELLFRATGDPNCKQLTIDEQRKNVHNADTEYLMAIADNIMACVNNKTDKDAILNDVLSKGCGGIQSDSFYKGDDDKWHLILYDEKGKYCDGLDLNEEPETTCQQILTEEEEIERQKRIDQIKRGNEMTESIKNNQFDDLLADVDIQELESEIYNEGFQDGVGGRLIDMLKMSKDQLSSEMDSEQRIALACKLIAFIGYLEILEMYGDQISSEDLHSAIKEPIEADKEAFHAMSGNRNIINSIEILENLHTALLAAEGLTDSDQCDIVLRR